MHFKANAGKNTNMHKIRLLTILLLFVCGCIAPQDTQTQAIFCPQEECEDRVAIAISNAEESVHIAMYAFTSEEIARELADAKKRGVDVKIVLDRLSAAADSSMKNYLTENGIETRIMKGSGAMHNKFFIIDAKITGTGSFNFTNNADERNNENIAFIFSEKTASEFENEFFRLWINAEGK